MSATKTQTAVEARDALWAKLDRVGLHGEDQRVAYARAEQGYRAADHELADLRVKLVLGEATADEVAAVEARRQEHADAMKAAEEQADAIRRASRQVEAEISHLHNTRRDEFEAHALQLSTEAEEAFAAIREPMIAAYEAWAAAARAWSTLGADVTEIGPPNVWPTDSPQGLFGSTLAERKGAKVVPRSPVPVSVRQPVKPPEAEVGIPTLWQRRDGFQTVALTGTVEYESVRNERDFALIATGAQDVAAMRTTRG